MGSKSKRTGKGLSRKKAQKAPKIFLCLLGLFVATVAQTLIVETAKSSGRPVAAHASTPEGMRRATLAGVETIEHGNAGTPEVFRLMKEHNVALCPTLTASITIARDLDRKRASFKAALDARVTIASGGCN